MEAAVLNPGQTFGGRYRVIRRMAAGGMGAVYEVMHLETERRRALKVLIGDLGGSEEFRERFRREARVTANIQSEFIVEVFDAGIDEATKMPFLVMELLIGEELSALVERGPVAPSDVLIYLQQAALALEKTHAASIVHRDLKPENVFLTRRDDGTPRVKILDFGISKVVSDSSSRAAVTRSLGTPLYMAPEQFRGERVQPATDIYALGMIAFTLLVGVPYWERESRETGNVFGFAARAADGPKEPASDRAASYGRPLSRAFDPWFACVTDTDPTRRFQSATQAIGALAAALESVPFVHNEVVVDRGAAATADYAVTPAKAATPPDTAFESDPNEAGAGARRSEAPRSSTITGTAKDDRAARAGHASRSRAPLVVGGGVALLCVVGAFALGAGGDAGPSVAPPRGAVSAATAEVRSVAPDPVVRLAPEPPTALGARPTVSQADPPKESAQAAPPHTRTPGRAEARPLASAARPPGSEVPKHSRD